MKLKKSYEYIIIGSGFGGAPAAYNLTKAGKEVLLIECGKWVTRDDSCWDEVKLHIKNPMYRGMKPIYADQTNGKIEEIWTDDTVGGMSTFYGAASFRLREEDFNGPPIPGSALRDENLKWPYKYNDVAPYYDEAEHLLGIAGISGSDITEPPRKSEYPHSPEKTLSGIPQKIWNASTRLGLHPFHLPMAINFSGKYGKGKCISCSTCNHYLCKIEAKNDMSVMLLPEAIKKGAVVLDNTRALKINFSENKARSVEILDQNDFQKKTINAKRIIVSAGALSSPYLLLCSGIGSVTGNDLTGRYLFRHANGAVTGLFPFKTNPDKKLQKRMGIMDYYFGAPFLSNAQPLGSWGMIQDDTFPGKEVVKSYLPFGLKDIAASLTEYLILLMCMAEDIPQYNNRVYLDFNRIDKFGMPALAVYHRYQKRDLKARNALYKKAWKIILKAGGMPLPYAMPFDTFSHAMGTCRMGSNKNNSVVDPECRVRDINNLYVMDGSVLPTCGSVNPSLTIAAVSLMASKMLLR